MHASTRTEAQRAPVLGQRSTRREPSDHYIANASSLSGIQQPSGRHSLLNPSTGSRRIEVQIDGGSNTHMLCNKDAAALCFMLPREGLIHGINGALPFTGLALSVYGFAGKSDGRRLH